MNRFLDRNAERIECSDHSNDIFDVMRAKERAHDFEGAAARPIFQLESKPSRFWTKIVCPPTRRLRRPALQI